MAVSAVWRLAYFARTLPIVTKEHANAHRRDALCPSPKIQMQAAFGIRNSPLRVSASSRATLSYIPLSATSG